MQGLPSQISIIAVLFVFVGYQELLQVTPTSLPSSLPLRSFNVCRPSGSYTVKLQATLKNRFFAQTPRCA